MLLGHWVEENGFRIRPIDDPATIEIDPGTPWKRIDPDSILANVAVYGSPDLDRDSFSPTIVVSLCAVEPAVDPTLLLERLADSAVELPGWRRVAWSTTADGDSHGSELVGEFRVDDRHLTSTTIATTWAEDDASMLFQVVVTTFSDQIGHHVSALRNAHPHREPPTAPTTRSLPASAGPLDI